MTGSIHAWLQSTAQPRFRTKGPAPHQCLRGFITIGAGQSKHARNHEGMAVAAATRVRELRREGCKYTQWGYPTHPLGSEHFVNRPISTYVGMISNVIVALTLEPDVPSLLILPGVEVRLQRQGLPHFFKPLMPVV